jgi:GTP-binding protein LepA
MTLLICWLQTGRYHSCVGKTGLGVENILAAVIERIPPPKEMLMSHYFDLDSLQSIRGIEVIFV